MAEAMTYDLLVADIQTYAERSDEPFTLQVPRFIMMAENRIASELRGIGFRRIAAFNMIAGETTYEKPARWRETVSLSIVVDGQRQYLFKRTYPFCRTFWPDSSVTGVPDYYTDLDYERMYIAGTPALPYSAELNYHERPEPLSAVNQTNWTTRYAPQLLLYASLLEAQPFLKLPERMQEFQMLYDRAAESVMKEEAHRVED